MTTLALVLAILAAYAAGIGRPPPVDSIVTGVGIAAALFMLNHGGAR